MLSVGKVNSAGRAASYFAADNYYTGSGEGPSEWMGRGAAALALSGAVGPKDFQNVLEGDTSFFGRNLGENLPEGRERLPGLDLTFSAPKSVSIMALVGGDQRLIEAHNLAVRETVEKIEASVATRRQIDGDMERETTRNAVVALFRHDTSRAQDPQLHTHAIFANATQGPDGKWRAMDARDWLKEGGSFIKEHGLAYRVALAAKLQELGYEITRGREGLFELSAVPKAVLDAYSSRGSAVEDHLEARGKTREEASYKEKQTAALDTRSAKIDLPRDQLVPHWQDQLSALGMDAAAIIAAAKECSVAPDYLLSLGAARTTAADKAVKFAALKLSERNARFTEDALRQEASVQIVGNATTVDLAAAIKKAASKAGYLDRQIVSVIDRETRGDALAPGFSTKWGAAIEERMLATERAGRGAVAAVVSRDAANQIVEIAARQGESVGHVWNDGHKTATIGILTSENRVTAVQGFAGVAKTSTVLATYARALEEAGYSAIGMAPTASAAKTLSGAGITATTIQQHLLDLDREERKLNARAEDESGESVGARMARLEGHAAEERQATQQRTRANKATAAHLAHDHHDDVGRHPAAGMDGKEQGLFSLLVNVGAYLAIGIADIADFFRQIADPKASEFDYRDGRGKLQYAFGGREVFLEKDREAWVVDEASLVDSKSMARLLGRAEQTGARVILVGDDPVGRGVGQLGSVAAGRAFWQLQDSGMKTYVLDQIVRQKNSATLDAVYASVDRNAAVTLEKIAVGGGAVVEIADIRANNRRPSIELLGQGRREAMVASYMSRDAAGRATTLVLEPSRAGREKTTDMIRNALRQEGTLVGPQLLVTGLHAKDATRVELSDPRTYAAGDMVRFERSYGRAGIEKGEYLTVQGAVPETGAVHLQKSDGPVVLWEPAKWGIGKVSAFTPHTMGVQVGDRLKWTGNDKAQGRVNGETVAVIGLDVGANTILVEGASGVRETIALEEARNRHIDHGYVQTLYEAQGRTASSVIVHAESWRQNLLNAKAFYVAISRAADRVEIFTDSKRNLTSAIGLRAGRKETALDTSRDRTSNEAQQQHGKMIEPAPVPNHESSRPKAGETAKAGERELVPDVSLAVSVRQKDRSRDFDR